MPVAPTGSLKVLKMAFRRGLRNKSGIDGREGVES